VLEARPGLPRQLGLLDATSIVVGTVIGSGIFLIPGLVAQHLPSSGLILGVWLFAGVLSFFGALAFAELGAMRPETGGPYVYLREAYGPLWAFLCGWTYFLVVQSGGIAAIASGFAIYLGHFVPLSPGASKAAAAALVAILTFVNYRGVKAGVFVQKLLTFLKVLGLALVAGSAFASARPSALEWSVSGFSWTGFSLALLAVLWAYDGWNLVSCTAGEVKEPQRNLPLSLALGVAFVTLVYCVVNLAYLRILPVTAMAASERPASDTAAVALGPAGATLVALAILLSIIGSANGQVLTPPRVYFAQARDGLFFRRFGEVHRRFQTPAFALAAQGGWSIVLILTGTFETLTSYAIFGSWVFYGMAVLAVPVLRSKHPEWPRPYRMWGYPATPVLFAAVALGFVLSTFLTAPGSSFTGLALIATGLPMYAVWRRRLA
jgi:APA family basic amino acid/polyamine antiporter